MSSISRRLPPVWFCVTNPTKSVTHICIERKIDAITGCGKYIVARKSILLAVKWDNFLSEEDLNHPFTLAGFVRVFYDAPTKSAFFVARSVTGQQKGKTSRQGRVLEHLPSQLGSLFSLVPFVISPDNRESNPGRKGAFIPFPKKPIQTGIPFSSSSSFYCGCKVVFWGDKSWDKSRVDASYPEWQKQISIDRFMGSTKLVCFVGRSCSKF